MYCTCSFLCLFYHNLISFTSIECNYPKPNIRLQCRFMRRPNIILCYDGNICEFYVITKPCVYCVCECECMQMVLKNQVNHLSLLDFSVTALLFVFSFTSIYETNRTSIIITRRTEAHIQANKRHI